MSNSVQDFYKNKTIFITGGSGFLGKVLIEKLLYSCSDLKEIVLLIREKNGKTGDMRVKEFEKLPIFERIMKEKPEVMNKINPVWGDISEPNFGLSDEHMGYIIENTQIVFHLAASLKLEAPLKTNIIMNLTAVKQMCDIAKKMKKLLVMIHSSTAFCIVEYVDIEEKVYDVEENPLDVIKNAENMSEYDLSLVEKKMLGKHLNTYTYTKRLSEVLVGDEYENHNLPICIVRPSMVTPALTEPVTGWVDNSNGSHGIIVAAARGIVRCLPLDSNGIKNYIPVDTCMNAYIMIAKSLGSINERPIVIPVYNLTTQRSKVISYQKYLEIFLKLRNKFPFSRVLWYPDVTMTTSKLQYYLNVALFQWTPAIIIDTLLTLFRQERCMIKAQKKIYYLNELIKCFTASNWSFETSSFEKLIKLQSNEEYVKFFIDTKKIDTTDYFEKSIVGARIYLAKDPLSTVARARVLLKVHYIFHLIAQFKLINWLITTYLRFAKVADPLKAKIERKLEFFTSPINMF